ncbi:hypothetical protein [Shewanella xiamenensis]|nr:hypothetical protein [Shewanella xiamenensis]
MQLFLDGLNHPSLIPPSYSLTKELNKYTDDELEDLAQKQSFNFYTQLPAALKEVYSESDLLIKERKINLLKSFIIEGNNHKNCNSSTSFTNKIFVRVTQESLELAVENNDSNLAISIIKASGSTNTNASNIFQLIKPHQTAFFKDVMASINEKNGLATLLPNSFIKETIGNLHYAMKKWVFTDQYPERLDIFAKSFPASLTTNRVNIYLNTSINACDPVNVLASLKYIPSNKDNIDKIDCNFISNKLSNSAINGNDAKKVFLHLRDHFSPPNDEPSNLLIILASFVLLIVNSENLDALRSIHEIPLVSEGRFLEKLDPKAQDSLLSLISMDALDQLIDQHSTSYILNTDFQAEPEVSTFSL